MEYDSLFKHELLNYNYFHIGLSGLSVDDYWSDDNPVSWAFSALMDRGDKDKIQRLETCYYRIYESGLADDAKSLLVSFTRTYNQLTPEESSALRERLGQASNHRVREMEYSYFGKVRQERLQEGLQQGLQRRHLMLLEMLQVKFGELSPVTTDRVKAIESQEELAALATKVLSAESLEYLGLNGAA